MTRIIRRRKPELAQSARVAAGFLRDQGDWCSCKRLRGDVLDGIHVKCGRPTQGGADGPTPIDIRSALRNDSRTGVGTVGDGIGEAGDPAPTLSTSGATPAVFVKAARASHAWNVDKGTVESWKDADVAPTLNVNDNTGDTRATAVVLDATPIDMRQAARGELNTNDRTSGGAPGTGVGAPGDPAYTVSERGQAVALAIDGRSGRTSDKTNTLTADMDSARVANRRSGTVMALTTSSVANYDENSAQAGHLLVDAPPMAECGCCPADPKPDSARYRACGNAVTVHVIEWIGLRMLSADAD